VADDTVKPFGPTRLVRCRDFDQALTEAWDAVQLTGGAM
jgi:hypothetical protein